MVLLARRAGTVEMDHDRQLSGRSVRFGSPDVTLYCGGHWHCQATGATRAFVGLLVLCSLAALAGCQQSQKESVQVEPGEQPGLTSYRIQPGDEIEVKFFYAPELNERLWVPPDGMISLQLAGRINAANLTAEELGGAITSAFENHLSHPQATVILRDLASRKVFVGGEVSRPGVQEMFGRMTVAQAIFQAGGARNTAKLSHVVVISHGPDRRPEHRVVSVKDFLKGKTEATVLSLKPYDVVFVPRTAIADLNLFVDQYLRKMIPITLSAGFMYNIDEIK